MTMASTQWSARARTGIACLSLGVLMVLTGTGKAHAEDTRTLAKFLANCNISSRDCRDNLHDYTLAASNQGMICIPKDLSINEAVSQELDWLRSAAAQKEDFSSGNAEDGEWAAVSTLYPCAGDSLQTATR